jgi:hypothetical protein
MVVGTSMEMSESETEVVVTVWVTLKSDTDTDTAVVVVGTYMSCKLCKNSRVLDKIKYVQWLWYCRLKSIQ